MGGVETGNWVRAGLRAVAGGIFAIGLALLNVPILVLWLLGLVLSPVPGLGMMLLPVVTIVVRWRANLQRRLAGRDGVPIARPYRPAPQRSPLGSWRQFRWIMGDPATWRDFAWLIPGALVGLALGLVTLLIPVYGVVGIILLPLWFYLADIWFGYGAFWPIQSLNQGWLAFPQGVLILALGLAGAPYLRTVDGKFDRLFLAPTRAAELRLRVTQLTVTRADTVDAQAAELRRIERDLHDGAQARLVSLGMTIGLADELVERDPKAARKLLAEARDASSAALVELRNLVRGIHPPVLAERGLDGAVRALALSLPVATTVESVLPQERLDTPVESAVYFAVAEVLANVCRHSGAHTAWVSLRGADGKLYATVGDDGQGGAKPDGGTGLRGIERRLAAFDGTMTLSSPPGGPTVVTMELPCVLSSPRTSPSSGTG
jgi:signal transduction histidine kinase